MQYSCKRATEGQSFAIRALSDQIEPFCRGGLVTRSSGPAQCVAGLRTRRAAQRLAQIRPARPIVDWLRQYGFPSGGRPVRRAAWPITQIDPRHSSAGSARRLRNRIESIWSESALAGHIFCFGPCAVRLKLRRHPADCLQHVLGSHRRFVPGRMGQPRQATE